MSGNDGLHPAVRALKTVCRCNNIKYRTIEKAIREGAISIGLVARETTATTGTCGGSCTSRVQSMIDEIAGGATAVSPSSAGSDEDDGDAWWTRR